MKARQLNILEILILKELNYLFGHKINFTTVFQWMENSKTHMYLWLGDYESISIKFSIYLILGPTLFSEILGQAID